MAKRIEQQRNSDEDKPFEHFESEFLGQDGEKLEIKAEEESVEKIERFISDIKETETREKVKKLLEELNLDNQSLATVIEEAKDNQECSCNAQIEEQLKALMHRNSPEDRDTIIGEKVRASSYIKEKGELLDYLDLNSPIYEQFGITPMITADREDMIKDLAKLLLEIGQEKLAQYDTIIGDDVAGRLPSLFMKKAIRKVKEKSRSEDSKIKSPEVFFVFAGRAIWPRSAEDDGMRKNVQLSQDAEKKRFKNIEKHFSGKKMGKTLVVTDFVDSGGSMVNLSNALENTNVDFDVAAVSLSEKFFGRISNSLFELIKDLQQGKEANIDGFLNIMKLLKKLKYGDINDAGNAFGYEAPKVVRGDRFSDSPFSKAEEITQNGSFPKKSKDFYKYGELRGDMDFLSINLTHDLFGTEITNREALKFNLDKK